MSEVYSFINPPPNPTISEIVKALAEKPGETDQCVHIHRDKPNEALPELFIGSLSVWLRADGSSFNGDYARPYVYPSAFGRMRLRHAVRRWIRETGRWREPVK